MEARLFEMITEQLQSQMDALRAEEQVRENKLRADARQRLQAALERLQIAHDQGLARRREQRLRQLQGALQRERWEAERGCVRRLLADVRKELAQRPCDPERLRQWFEQARALLPGAERLRPEVRPDWLEAARAALPKEVQITSRPMLGGALLIDLKHGRIVDGSWDRRLAEVEAEIWMRWRGDVGADH